MSKTTAPNNELQIEPIHGKVLGLATGQLTYRLLVAEDQPENRLLIHKILEPLGFEMRDAFNGEEAIEQFEIWQPDLIWMDMRMPVIDGLEATRRIRASKNGNAVRIVALTAHALEDERLLILEAGCDDVVRKPYRESELLYALTTHLGVCFTYEDNTTTSPTNNQEITTEQLQQLLVSLFEQLHEVLVLLDEERCVKMAGVISDINPDLGGRIRDMVEQFQYKKLLSLLEQIVTKNL